MIDRRHGGESHHSDPHNSHYANVGYGSLVFKAVLIYLVAVLVLKKAYYMFITSSKKGFKSLRMKKLMDNVISFNPYLHLGVILIITFGCKFVDLQITHVGVYLKKIARLSYVLTFANLFMVIPRSNYFIFMTYLDSIRFHVWLSVFILGLSTLHSLLFLGKWIVQGIFWKNMLEPKITLGFAIFVVTFALLVLSLTDYRRKHYDNFYLLHQIGMIMFVVLTILHADPQITAFGVLNIAFLCIMVVNKYINRFDFDGEDPFVVTEVKDYGTLTIVSFSNNKIKSLDSYCSAEKSVSQKLVPGTHIRLHEFSFFAWQYWLKPSHPFTLVSNNELLFKKNEFSRFKSNFKPAAALSIVGIYNPNESIEVMLKESARKRVNIVAGGSGISFAVPILSSLLDMNEKKGQERDLISLYWSISDFNDSFIIVYFLTKIIKDENMGTPQLFLKLNITGDDTLISEEQTENLKLQLNQFKGALDFDIEYGNRLEFSSLATEEEFSSYTNSFKEWVVCCGPADMIEGCKRFVDATNFKVESDAGLSRDYTELISEVYEF